MLTIETLKELLEKLHTRSEKIHSDNNSTHYIKGFIAGEIHIIGKYSYIKNYLYQECFDNIYGGVKCQTCHIAGWKTLIKIYKTFSKIGMRLLAI